MKDSSEKVYIAIDLKSFYASVECVERGLDPLSARLVVADPTRTEKTICLAVTPALKAYGIPGRARLFEVVQKVKQIKAERGIELDYIVAPPRMALYMDYSCRVYNIYLKYIAPEDIHVYSVDEVFMDVTEYLHIYKMSAHDLAMKMILEVLHTTGITATAGIGTNMYLCKIAMDIEAKHMKADENGVRIAELDEMSYRKSLWAHRPLTDFWRVGRGYAKRLEAAGIYTMGDIARCSVGSRDEYYNENLLYKMFGINAELLIDHAWGYEPCTIAEIKSYKPSTNSISQGQVLKKPYPYEKAKLIVREMTELLVLDLVKKHLETDQIVLNIVYDIDNILDKNIRDTYNGEVVSDHYGRFTPKPVHGSENLDGYTSSTHKIMDAMMHIFDRIVDRNLLVRRVYVVANHVLPEKKAKEQSEFVQLDLFSQAEPTEQESIASEREKKMQNAVLSIQKRYGKNAILKGMNLQEGGTTMERNGQIGGHRA